MEVRIAITRDVVAHYIQSTPLTRPSQTTYCLVARQSLFPITEAKLPFPSYFHIRNVNAILHLACWHSGHVSPPTLTEISHGRGVCKA